MSTKGHEGPRRGTKGLAGIREGSAEGRERGPRRATKEKKKEKTRTYPRSHLQNSDLHLASHGFPPGSAGVPILIPYAVGAELSCGAAGSQIGKTSTARSCAGGTPALKPKETHCAIPGSWDPPRGRVRARILVKAKLIHEAPRNEAKRLSTNRRGSNRERMFMKPKNRHDQLGFPLGGPDCRGRDARASPLAAGFPRDHNPSRQKIPPTGEFCKRLGYPCHPATGIFYTPSPHKFVVGPHTATTLDGSTAKCHNNMIR